ncbi:DEAD/DEAH box helicase [Patescibacteria group bacterium]|nr:DEAD/DEAH box helicase [Patescibacteria group bacterium]MBU1705178.1 DEAD/DEAH box helicase [Patescibacteria group bacterium]
MSRNELKQQDFQGLGISQGLLKRIAALGFDHPTPIQFKAIPVATAGEDVVGIAQTGSGKTLAFAIPVLQHIGTTKQVGLVLLPTRELAVQVEETFRKIAGAVGLRTALIIGGINPQPQIRQLKAKPHVIVATPGRLIDHLEQKRVNLSNVGILILDEADRMLDMGFAPQLKRILTVVPKDRQTMLFSATMPDAIAAIANQYMKKPLRIEVAKSGTTADKVDQEIIMVQRTERMDLLEQILEEYKGSVLIFSRTKHGATKIARKIRQMGHSADEIHSNRSQSQRQNALRGFATGKHRILVATDIAARGIDVEDVQLVLNYDLPDQIEDYVHRIGRTARAGKSGKAISFAAPAQKRDIQQIEKLINITIPIKTATGKMIKLEKAAPAGDHGAKPPGQPRPNRHGRHRPFTPKRNKSNSHRRFGPNKSKRRRSA